MIPGPNGRNLDSACDTSGRGAEEDGEEQQFHVDEGLCFGPCHTLLIFAPIYVPPSRACHWFSVVSGQV